MNPLSNEQGTERPTSDQNQDEDAKSLRLAPEESVEQVEEVPWHTNIEMPKGPSIKLFSYSKKTGRVQSLESIPRLNSDERLFVHLHKPDKKILDQVSNNLVNPEIIERVVNSRKSGPIVPGTAYPEPRSTDAYQLYHTFYRLDIRYDPNSPETMRGIDQAKVHGIVGKKYTIYITDEDIPELDAIADGFGDQQYEDLVDRTTPYLSDVVQSVMRHNADNVIRRFSSSIRINADAANYNSNKWAQFYSWLSDTFVSINEVNAGIESLPGNVANFTKLFGLAEPDSKFTSGDKLSALHNAVGKYQTQLRILQETIQSHKAVGEIVKTKSRTPFEQVKYKVTGVVGMVAGLALLKPAELFQAIDFSKGESHWAAAVTYGTIAALTWLGIEVYERLALNNGKKVSVKDQFLKLSFKAAAITGFATLSVTAIEVPELLSAFLSQGSSSTEFLPYVGVGALALFIYQSFRKGRTQDTDEISSV